MDLPKTAENRPGCHITPPGPLSAAREPLRGSQGQSAMEAGGIRRALVAITRSLVEMSECLDIRSLPCVPFPMAGRRGRGGGKGSSKIPESPGVYFIINGYSGEIIYIGQSKNHRIRVRSHNDNEKILRQVPEDGLTHWLEAPYEILHVLEYAFILGRGPTVNSERQGNKRTEEK